MTMTSGRWIYGAALFAILAIGQAQPPAAKWTELQRHDIPGTTREGVTMAIEIPPGITSARHSHPGEDFGYVIEGTIMLYVDGYPPKTVKAGEVFFTERGHVHNARNIGTVTARAVDTYVVDKGQPVTIPAQ